MLEFVKKYKFRAGKTFDLDLIESRLKQTKKEVKLTAYFLLFTYLNVLICLKFCRNQKLSVLYNNWGIFGGLKAILEELLNASEKASFFFLIPVL